MTGVLSVPTDHRYKPLFRSGSEPVQTCLGTAREPSMSVSMGDSTMGHLWYCVSLSRDAMPDHIILYSTI
jgi:hypothetical protein